VRTIWAIYSSLIFTDTLSFVEALKVNIEQVETRVSQSQQNLKQMEKVIGAWVDTPVFQRKGGARDGLLSLEDKDDQLNAVFVCLKI